MVFNFFFFLVVTVLAICAFFYMNIIFQYKVKIRSCCQGLGKGGWVVSIGKMKGILQIDGGDGCTTMCVYVFKAKLYT